MVKAVLRCTDCLQDLNNVTQCLLKNGLVIKKVKPGDSIYPTITVCAQTSEQLFDAIKETNRISLYGVSVLKVK